MLIVEGPTIELRVTFVLSLRFSPWVLSKSTWAPVTQHLEGTQHGSSERTQNQHEPMEHNTIGAKTQHLGGTQHGSSERNTVDFGSTQHFAGTQQDPSKLNTGQEPNTIDRLK